MTTLHLLRVFTAADGSVGNPLGVFLDGDAVPQDQRQSVAADLGYSETVFVDDQLSGRIEIYTPLHRLAFAGHPLVGSSWLLSRELEREISSLRPPVGEVRTWVEGGLTWIRGRPEWSPPFSFHQLDSADEVAALRAPPSGRDDGYYWAWEDEAAGLVRSRNFIASLGISEDPATGSAAVSLASRLGRHLVITQGDGCRLDARLGPAGTAEVGGQVVLVEMRDY